MKKLLVFRQLLKRPKFFFGFSYLILILLASFLYEPVLANFVKVTDVIYEGATPIGEAPFSPMDVFPFGTDRVGTPLWTYVVQGAKYTILLGLVISLMQVVISCVIAILFYRLIKKIFPFIESLVDTMIYIPAAAIAFLLLFPIQFVMEPEEDFLKYLLFQALLITIIGIPPLINVIVKEIGQVMKEEYVTSARTLGARGLHLYRVHVLKNLYPRLILLFFQRNVQVLILFVHLGLLKIFLGGAVEKEINPGVVRLFSLSNEWAGNIGKAYFEIMLAPWIIFVPLVAFSITILSFNFITSTLQEYFLNGSINFKNCNEKTERMEDAQKLSNRDFVLLTGTEKIKPPL